MPRQPGFPEKDGLYDPAFERDACGVGCVVDIKGRRSHEIVSRALEVLVNLLHRGATGAEHNTGDGAGIVLQLPDEFLRDRAADLGISLPIAGSYGVGMMCMPRDDGDTRQCQELVEEAVQRTGQGVLGWRRVPTSSQGLGQTAVAVEPQFWQIFISKGSEDLTSDEFERKLYVIRRRSEQAIHRSGIPSRDYFYAASLSSRTIVYKGMLSAKQIETYFPELKDTSIVSALAIVHQRFSTNTFPSWSLAHPFRYLSHNGEINTLRGNINWMRARQAMFASNLFGEDMRDLVPVLDEAGSDSAILDNALEMLVLSGRSLPHALMMLIPEAWQAHAAMSDEKRAFYEYHSCLMEPWDGPAAIVFTDGTLVGGLLDRNGLRPARYYVTKNDLVVLASEVGVVDFKAEEIASKGRLEPGRMFLIDTREGRIVGDEEIKESIATAQPYRQWLRDNLVRLEDLPFGSKRTAVEPEALLRLQRTFGYTHEEIRLLMEPMVSRGEEAIGSMGTDAPLAVLSDRNPNLYSYFKQLFAQVTNPPLDAIREELVTSLAGTLGSEGNLLDTTPEQCRHIVIPSAVLSNEDMERLAAAERLGFGSEVLDATFRAGDGPAGIVAAMSDLRRQASDAIRRGASLLILSDRGADFERAPIPSLLAVAGVHHHLVSAGDRTRAALVVETGDAREVHHFCLLIGYGANAVNPWLAFETIDDMLRRQIVRAMEHRTAVKQFVKAANKGILKVISKMGISTLQSYRGAQIFEAIGLNERLINEYFCGTPSRIQGAGIEDIAAEVLHHHARAFGVRSGREADLDGGSQYQWRQDGEYHMYNPDTIHKLQIASRTNNYRVFKEYSAMVDDASRHLCTLRGLMDLQFAETPVPLDEVEPAEEIMKRFATGAMSFGSISKVAHETLAIAMNRISGRSNTGEGGEDPARFTPDANGDSRSSAIKQVASGRFGVTSEYLVNAKELQIKMAQGAKPGEGGQLPGHKVDEIIARVRYSTPGVGLISPPPHHDIYSIEDLAQLIYDLKNSNDEARISVKLVSEVGVGTVAAGVAKAHADAVLISGDSGGTGASPLTSIKHAGGPWELGVAETHQTLVKNNLRTRIVVQTDGQLKTGRDVVIAAMLGAEEFGFATSALVASGCILMRVCHLNTCPVGIATQDRKLHEKFTGKPEHIVNFFRMIAEEIRELMSKLGFRTVNEMVGRSDRLNMTPAIDHWKARNIDLSRILARPQAAPGVAVHCVETQNHGLDKALDHMLVNLCEDALKWKKEAELFIRIRNTNRTVGTLLGSRVTRNFGSAGLPEDTIRIRFTGSAGQSFGAFVPPGVSLALSGDSNDYFGKGLSGGILSVSPPEGSSFKADENVIIGNVALYGATRGKAFIRGVAGERFAVRNSGADAVVEGVGDHGCEYMTGGLVVVLGKTGRNFAAGMSGGVAYVLDEDGTFPGRCNREMVDLEEFEDVEEEWIIRGLIGRHVLLTGSPRGQEILDNWEIFRTLFVKVMPKEYRKALMLASEKLQSTMVHHG